MKKQNGVTLLETILVLSLISIIMIGGLGLYDSASKKSKSNELIRDVNAAISQLRSLSPSLGTDQSVNLNTLSNAGMLPGGFTSNSKHKNFDGYIILRIVNSSFCSPFLEIAFLNAPMSKEMCTSLFTTNWGSLHNSNSCWGNGFNNVDSGSGSTGYIGEDKYPTVTEAAAACAGDGDISAWIYVHP